MRREYRPRPDAVVERRLALADKPKSVSPDAETWSRLATLPAGQTSDDERLHARRSVARHVMRSHGCKGRKCGYGAHEGHLAVRDELLAVLGLGGDLG